MNWLTLIFRIAPTAILATQQIIGEAASGATKHQLAKDAINAALGVVAPALGPDNAALAQAASAVTSMAIDQAVTITKATGAYQKATVIAAAAQQDAGVAAAVAQLVQSVQDPKALKSVSQVPSNVPPTP